jgi:hypothetical protein
VACEDEEVWHKKKQWLIEATVFFYGVALTAEWKVLTDCSSRTEQSHRLERDRLIARIDFPIQKIEDDYPILLSIEVIDRYDFKE